MSVMDGGSPNGWSASLEEIHGGAPQNFESLARAAVEGLR